MRRLLDRVVGRRAPDGREPPEPLALPAQGVREGAASSAPAGGTVPDESRAHVIEALRRHIAEASGGRLRIDEVDADAQLFDRGYLDSFSYVEFLAFIEHSYRVRIDDSQLAGHLSTIAAMAEHILQAEAHSSR